MDFLTYQKQAMSMALDSSKDLNYLMPGLTAEAGELAGKWAKVIRDDNGVISPERRSEMLKELGDTLWFLAVIAEQLDYSLDSSAQDNIDKLQSRKTRGVLSGSGDNR